MRNLQEVRAEVEAKIVEEASKAPIILGPSSNLQAPRIKVDTFMGLLEESCESFEKLITKEFRISNDEMWDILDLQIRLEEYVKRIRQARSWKERAK
jgi:hypothetical protein